MGGGGGYPPLFLHSICSGGIVSSKQGRFCFLYDTEELWVATSETRTDYCERTLLWTLHARESPLPIKRFSANRSRRPVLYSLLTALHVQKKNGIAGHTGCFKHLGLWSWSTVDIRQRKLFFFCFCFLFRLCSDTAVARHKRHHTTSNVTARPESGETGVSLTARKESSERTAQAHARKSTQSVFAHLNEVWQACTLVFVFCFFTLACDWRRASLPENVFENQQLRAEGAGACISSIRKKKQCYQPPAGLENTDKSLVDFVLPSFHLSQMQEWHLRSSQRKVLVLARVERRLV